MLLYWKEEDIKGLCMPLLCILTRQPGIMLICTLIWKAKQGVQQNVYHETFFQLLLNIESVFRLAIVLHHISSSICKYNLVIILVFLWIISTDYAMEISNKGKTFCSYLHDCTHSFTNKYVSALSDVYRYSCSYNFTSVVSPLFFNPHNLSFNHLRKWGGRLERMTITYNICSNWPRRLCFSAITLDHFHSSDANYSTFKQL